MKPEDKMQLYRKKYLQRCWMLSKNQADYRDEPWNISLEEYTEMWSQDDAWLRRGRSLDDLILSRIDFEKGWSLDNVHLQTRRDFFKEKMRGRKRRPRK